MNAIKVALIGLDGATWDVALKYVKEGKLPTLQRLMAEGSWGTLLSTIPFNSAAAWTSISTGVNPGKHGLFEFTVMNGYGQELVNASYRKVEALWGTLSRRGKRVVVVNIPVTYPPEAVNGVMVSGMDTPAGCSAFTYPSGLAEKLLQAGYVLDAAGNEPFEPSAPERFAGKLVDVLRRRGVVAIQLYREYQPDFFMVNFDTTDRVQHYFAHTVGSRNGTTDYVYEVYRECDRVLGDFLEAMEENTVLFLVSDHGHGPVHHRFLVNSWLKKEGLLQLQGRPLGSYLRRPTLARLARLLGWRDNHRPSPRPSSFSRIDWTRTRVWCSGVFGGLCINLRGRQTAGIVEPGEYEALRARLVEALEKLTDPATGQRVVEKVHRREELYSGPWVSTHPDLIIQARAGYVCKPSLRPGAFLRPVAPDAPRTGVHRREGIVVTYGAGIQKGSSLAEACVYDIAPTVLHLMGIPIPREVDGRVLTETLAEGSEAARRAPVYGDREKERVRERIARLRGQGVVL